MDIEELVRGMTKLKKVLGELKETPYELLKVEQERVWETTMEKQVTTLNNTFINFFKWNVPNPNTPSSPTVFEGCQIYEGGDHLVVAYLRLNEP
jgi:hypothetical protein